jgi:hypothetical protein
VVRILGLVAGAAGLVLVCLQAPLSAATPEAQVKAAYLFKLASFVRWPSMDGASPFRICVSGRADIAAVLHDLAANEAVGGRPIAVSQLGAGDTDQARGCAILFVGRGAETGRSLLSASAGAPVLTVSDRNGGTRGGAVEFVLRDGKVRFVIRRREAESRQLELSSKLLDSAVAVEQ